MMIALSLTIVTEFIVVMIMAKKIQVGLFSIAVNIITNIIFNYIARYVSPEFYFWYIILGEVTVVIVETMLYFLLLKNFKKALFIALAANLASYVIGEVLSPYIYL